MNVFQFADAVGWDVQPAGNDGLVERRTLSANGPAKYLFNRRGHSRSGFAGADDGDASNFVQVDSSIANV